MVILERESVFAPEVESAWKPQVIERKEPIDDGPAQAGVDFSSDDVMDGFEALVRALRHPELIFGPPSARPAYANAKPLDWDCVAEQLAECFQQWQGRCSDLHFQLHLGAAVLRKHGVKICRGGPWIVFMEEDGPLHVFIQLSVDVAPGQVSSLNHELDDQVIDADAQDTGCFCFCFCSGKSVVGDIDVAIDKPIG
ncbi:hypothetical protein ACQ859_12665 [Roseateles chitinivorans]|uniref:hypothetical protein n=1 Tax=Roseateles chitinivorans TaxID=2917965 RepID=UPI003D676BCC